MNLNINITLDKWGLFEPFDGENFSSDLRFLFSRDRQKNYDWYIQTKKISLTEYIVYYVPTKRELKYYPDKGVRKIYVTDCLIKQFLKENNYKIGIWEINTEIDVIEIDDFIWYYLGLAESCGIESTINLNKSQKRMEIEKNIEKFSQ